MSEPGTQGADAPESTVDLLRGLEQDVREEFEANRRVLSFDQYFELFCSAPEQQIRTAPQYVRDCLDYFGVDKVSRPQGTVARYRLFDAPWDPAGAPLSHRVVGQEQAQHDLYRMLTNFVQEGRVTRLVLLHGPNGSAKSSFIRALARGLEVYARADEGAVYRFNWVFPSARVSKKRLGFGGTASDEPRPRRKLESFAHLDEDDIDARMPGDLRDHPMLLLPKERRRPILERLQADGSIASDTRVGDYLIDGDLSPRSRAIADALLNAYHGDFQRVLQHVQVERFFFSRRYRKGLVTIEPQLHVDAGIRQLTMDQQLQSLPPSLRTLSLFEPFGDLVDANRGLLEYNDLLKKPLDSYKYLLATCEKGTVSLANAILHLDVLLLASSNERHLNAFKEYQDFPSFKGRMDLVKMAYLRDYRVEEAIYREQVTSGELGEIIAPHSTWVVALWAVLTRLRKPSAERVSARVKEVVARLSPLEKAELYAGEREPADLTAEQSRELRAVIPQLLSEGQEELAWEGSFGASPREMKQVLLNTLQEDNRAGVTPLGIFDELLELVKMKSVYEFLKLPATEGGYHDAEGFVNQVRGRWLDKVDMEVRSSMGLVSEQEYDDLFGRYIRHASYALKGERIYNEATGRSEEPDTHLMDKLEGVWKAPEDRERFRRELIGRVGAWRIDFPGEDIDYRRLFPKLFGALEEDYYRKQKGTIGKLGRHVLAVLRAENKGEPGAAEKLSEADTERAEGVIERMVVDHGYPRVTISEAVSELMSERYQAG